MSEYPVPDQEKKPEPLYTVLRVLEYQGPWNYSEVRAFFERELDMTACSLRRDPESRVVFQISKSQVWSEHIAAMKELVPVTRAADERFGAEALGYVVDTLVHPYEFGPRVAVKVLELPPKDMAILAEGRLWLDVSVISADPNDLRRPDEEE